MIMKFFKWSFIGVGAVIAVFLFLLISVRLYLNTDRAQQQLQAKVNQAIPGTITWSMSRLSVWKGEVELHNVLLSAPTNDKLVELNRLFLRISWNRLLKGVKTLGSNLDYYNKAKTLGSNLDYYNKA